MSDLKPAMATHMFDAYLPTDDLGDIDGQCPMLALPSDVAKASEAVQASFQHLLTAMVWLFETNIEDDSEAACHQAHYAAALCVGGMVLA